MGSLLTKARTATMASSTEIKQYIKDAVSKDKVVVFSKSYCPYCTLAKDVSLVLFFKSRSQYKK